jgi:aminoglycoside phosphotransferase family enzyme/predicted kinase
LRQDKTVTDEAKGEPRPAGSQEDLVAAMLDPAFYPEPPREIVHKETHISHVFLAGDLAYKIKKAVRFAFLDYSTLSRRHHFLREELRLNRRLAPSVYRTILPITRGPRGWRLGGRGTAREYALVMRRLPEDRMLAALLTSGGVSAAMMEQLAEVLAPFHERAKQVKALGPARHRAQVAREWNDNLAELRPLAGTLFAANDLAALEEFGAWFLAGHAALLDGRAREGRVRDVHGDLHCEHVCFAPEGIQIYDCIEFSPQLRRCDVAAEIAFLLMDLEVRGGGRWRAPFVERYLALVQDAELPRLLPFYECHRALVRAKVESLRPDGARARAPHYFEYAVALTWEPLKPFLVLVAGLTGSGKSTLASELGRRLRLPVINSDVVRKELAGAGGAVVVPFGADIYSASMTEKTYDAMLERAQEQMRRGSGAILDATFNSKANRRKFLGLARASGTPLAVIHCSAPDEITRKRLERRLAAGKDISDGRWEIYQEQKRSHEAMEEIAPSWQLELDTESAVEQLAARSEKFLRERIKPHPPASRSSP